MPIGRFRVEVAVGRHVAAALADRGLEAQAAAVGQRRDRGLGVEDLELRVVLEGVGGHAALRLDVERERPRSVVVQADREALEVEDDVRDVFDDARDGRELVLDALDLHRGDRGALDRREEDAPERVADRRAPAALERLRREAAVVALLFIDLETVRTLKTLPQHVSLLSLRLIR